MPPRVFDHELGEPDDLFADIHNFAVYAIFHLNLMILAVDENKVLPTVSNHQVTITMNLENLMTSLQTYNCAVSAIFPSNLMIWS
jgi:hypothetical protein